jgi:hypothetical protein
LNTFVAPLYPQINSDAYKIYGGVEAFMLSTGAISILKNTHQNCLNLNANFQLPFTHVFSEL